MPADVLQRDYEFYTGTDYVRRLTLVEDGKPVNLTDYRAAMQLRSTYTSPVAFEMSTDNGRIEISPEEGQVDLVFKASDTTSISPGRYLFDLELYAPDDTVIRILVGTITFFPEVTRCDSGC